MVTCITILQDLKTSPRLPRTRGRLVVSTTALCLALLAGILISCLRPCPHSCPLRRAVVLAAVAVEPSTDLRLSDELQVTLPVRHGKGAAAPFSQVVHALPTAECGCFGHSLCRLLLHLRVATLVVPR